MQTAHNSVTLDLPAEQAKQSWQDFTASGTQEEVDSGEVTDERLRGERGTIVFEEADGGTRATMELRYNEQALTDAGLDRQWVADRIGMYLERFKQSANA